MNKIRLIICLSLIAVLPLSAIFDDYEPSVRARAMAGTYTATSDAYDGIFYNPAGLSLAGNQYGGAYTQLFGNSFTGLTTIGG
ncbi:MAG TPA: transporter, partial [Candidatus Cloacimonadota bacterium]|nr:transporter [Candidatus Cloacimonadota bacterium]